LTRSIDDVGMINTPFFNSALVKSNCGESAVAVLLDHARSIGFSVEAIEQSYLVESDDFSDKNPDDEKWLFYINALIASGKNILLHTFHLFDE